MVDSPKLHQEVLDWVKKEFNTILKDSGQAIYIYVCNRHKICNGKFSSLLGYNSPKEWEMKEEVLGDVKESNQPVLVSAYRNAMERKIGSNINISWKNAKTGKFIKTNVILVPLSYKGQMFALHFITKI